MGVQGKESGFTYAREFANILGTDACAIYLHLGKPDKLLLIDAEGYPEQSVFQHTYEPNFGPVARVWQQKKFLSLIWDDEGRTDISLHEAAYRSFLGIPFQRAEDPDIGGVLSFQTVDKWIFPTGQIVQARKFGEVVAAAVPRSVAGEIEALWGAPGPNLRETFGEAIARARKKLTAA